MTDERDTWPAPSSERGEATEPTPLQGAVRQAVAEALSPIRGLWDARSQDMLDVLAEASAARVEVRRGVRTIRICSWLGVLGLLLAGASIFVVLDGERTDRRRAVQMQEGRRDTAVESINAHVDVVCRRR